MSIDNLPPSPKASRPSPPLGPPRPAAHTARAEAERANQRSWQINWRLLAATALVVVVLGGASYGWHAFQVRRNAAMYLARADELEAQGRWSEALQNVGRYLLSFPDDVEARVRQAQIFDHLADRSPSKLPAAERLYSVAVGLAPDRADLRLKHGERLWQLGRYRAALDEAHQALRLNAADPQALRLQAMAAYGDARARGDFSAAAELEANFRRAIDANRGTPDHVDLAVQLAEMYRRDLVEPVAAERRTRADQIVDAMVEHNATRPAAWIARYLYHARNDGAGNEADLDRALALDAERSDGLVCLVGAERARVRKQAAEAIELYQRALLARPDDPRAYIGLSQSFALDHQTDEMIAVLKRGLAAVGPENQSGVELALTQAYVSAGKLDDADQALEVAARHIDTRAPRQSGSESTALRSTLHALRAQIHMARQQYLQAIGCLRRSLLDQSSATQQAEIVRRAELLMQLGRCHVAMRQWDQAAAAFKESAALQPQSAAPLLAAGQAWQSAGRLDEAVRDYRQAAARPNAGVETWAMLIDAQLRHQVTIADEGRDWKPVEESLAAARQRFPRAAELDVLATQLDDVRNGTRNTLEIIERRQVAEPTSLPLAERLLLSYESSGQAAEADGVLARFSTSAADEADVALLRATLHVARKEFPAAKALLGEALARVAPDRQTDVKFRLATLALQTDELDEAKRILNELAAQDGTGDAVLELLADLALGTRDLKELAHWEEQLREHEGPEGSSWRFYRVQRLLAEAASPRDARLAEAGNLVADVQRLRPQWPAGFMLEGQVAQRRGQTDAAIEAYTKAIDLGENRAFVREQLVALLYATNQGAKAEALLAQFGNAAPLSPRMANIAIALRLREGDSAKAVQLAQSEVDRRPDDPMSHVTLGQTLLDGKQSQRAEQAFREAIRVAPHDVRGWQALFAFLLNAQRRDEALQTVRSMAGSVNLPQAELLPVIGQDFVLLGDLAGAERAFRKLLELAPDDATALRRVAGFFRDRDPAVADDCLRRARKLQPDSVESRLDLIAFLISRGGEVRLAEAAEMLGGAGSDAARTAAEQSLMAQLLIRRGGADDRAKAKRILEELVASEAASDSDRVSLVGLYEVDGRLSDALSVAYVLINRPNPQPSHLAGYVALLLSDKGRTEEARRRLKQLAALDPNGFTTVSLHARLLAQEGRRAQIAPVVEKDLERRLKRAPSELEKSEVLAATANLYSDLHLEDEAERTYRRIVEQSADAYQPLAQWLASHGRAAEAVELCLRAAKTDDSPQAATVLARALVLGNADAKLASRAEPTLAAAQSAHPEHVDLLFMVATWRLVQGRNAEAATLLRRVLELDPRNAMTMNNLASLLVEQPESRAEAATLVDRALALAGPLAQLLDTKGLVLLSEGDVEGAVDLFTKATARSDPDPVHLFHLALALRRLGRTSEARAELQKARQHALADAVLSPVDHQRLVQLEQDLQG